MAHRSLLDKVENKYQLVLEIAKRAKVIKDEIGKSMQPGDSKPIPLAIQEALARDAAE